MKLHPAMSLAERIQQELAPLSAQCEIAGSIRRARVEVNDIDLVILPKPGQLAAIKERCQQRCRVIRDGDQNFICALKLKKGFGADASTSTRDARGPQEFQLDIFFAHAGTADLLDPQPGNFGTLLLCRTGSREHNIQIAQRAKQLDMKWNPYRGLLAGGAWEFKGQDAVYVGGKIIASETEAEIFSALGLNWIAPAYREASSAGFNLVTQPTATTTHD